MPLLVLAQTPPPTHGQSAMVQAAVEGLPGLLPGVQVHHQNLALSTSGSDIGRWKWRKFTALRTAYREAKRFLQQNPGTVIYYVPAPGRRIAALRDCLLLPGLRRHAAGLVLHWHGAGLGEWTATHPLWRRWLMRAIGNADVSILPSDCVRADAQAFLPKQVAIVPNGIPDVSVDQATTWKPGERVRVLFIGACTEEKGIFVLAEAWRQLTASHPQRFELVVAGSFPSADAQHAFLAALGDAARDVRMEGFVSGAAKERCIQETDIICIPTHYPYEIQPLVALEALAADKVVVATRWRGLPELLDGTVHCLTEAKDPSGLAGAIVEASRLRSNGTNRAAFEARFTREKHLASLAKAVLPILGKGTDDR